MNEFYGFFGARRVFAWSYQEMVFLGALEQLQPLLYVGIASLMAWKFLSDFSPARRTAVLKSFAYWSPVALALAAYGVLYALGLAEEHGMERARKLAVDSEQGIGSRTTVLRRTGAMVSRISGFRVACTDRACLLYLPGEKKTTGSAKQAAGTTALVLLDSSSCVVSRLSTTSADDALPDC
ncbi:hypothetical protein [Ramlibacter humi]|uniref:Uncharacterized protein n=1 Tax=Ramlibacter humi TaxID=2530451 RepID=A0A4Z0BRH1_9BURK|nr:hypothetical protein [Ramlibacter humi]TFZ01917.1 hypothetical protein EZ216_12065 [Ramlibacter humi]